MGTNLFGLLDFIFAKSFVNATLEMLDLTQADKRLFSFLK